MQGLLSGIPQFAAALASPGQLAAAEPGAAAAAGAAAVAAFSCTRVVAFLQLAIGCVLPTALYLWSEGEVARQYITDEQVCNECLLTMVSIRCSPVSGQHAYPRVRQLSSLGSSSTRACTASPSRTHPPYARTARHPHAWALLPVIAHTRQLGAALAGMAWQQAGELAGWLAPHLPGWLVSPALAWLAG